MIIKNVKERHLRRRLRIRKKIVGTSERPRLSVSRSLKHVYAQIVDDEKGRIVVAVSSLSKELREERKSVKTPVERSKVIGKTVAKLALEKNITQVVFDRSGSLYHGRVKAVADGAREVGLKL
ncbi:MAG: 50S ribosomal protein L18 [Proteobacteria bacterium]|nr:50S ribosomal protein L18 [Pseudomonadota bacterium]